MDQIRVAIIGYGAIGHPVVQALRTGVIPSATIEAVLVRNLKAYQTQIVTLSSEIIFTDQVDDILDCAADLVVEAAGQDAVSQYGIRILQSGKDFMVTSIGAFTDDRLFDKMTQCAVENNQNLYLVAGALPGVDWMQGSSRAEVTSIKITQTKPVLSWQGTPAEEMVDLREISEATCFFSGTARQAASIFQKSSNITAMLAISTVGLDRAQVDLVADPNFTTMHTLIEFRGEAGDLTIEWRGVPSTLNPSTSKDVPLSVLKAIKNIASSVKLGV